MFYLDEDHKETMIKGDTMLDDHRRVILISTDAQMETLARAKTILGDGTFKIAPSLRTQVFIISAQVDTDVFVPCCYAMLPDICEYCLHVFVNVLYERRLQYRKNTVFFFLFSPCQIFSNV